MGIGENVLFGDDIQRAKTLEFEQCKETNFIGDERRKLAGRLKIDQLDSGQQVIVGLEDGVSSKTPQFISRFFRNNFIFIDIHSLDHPPY